MSERQVVFGTLAMASVNVARAVLQLAVLPVLARLLDPSSFGLVALAMPVILFPSMISDLGLGNALVRIPNATKELESTIFWLSMAMAASITVLIVLAAWPVGNLLSEPRLPPIIIALAFVLPMCASLTVSNARITRSRRFELFAKGEIISNVIAAGSAIAAAFAGMGAWSLVVQQFVLWIVKMSYLWPRAGFQPSFFCKPSLVRPHLTFGVNAAGSNLVEFVMRNVPPVIIGGTLGVTVVGHYSVANQIARAPDMIVTGPMYLPVFSTVARNQGRQQATFVLRGLRGLVTVLAPIFGMAVLAGDLVIQILFGPKWVDAGPMLMMLAPSAFFICIYMFIGAVLMGLGRSGHQFALLSLDCVLIFLGTFIGTFYGPEGAAAGLSLGTALALPAYVETICRQLSIPRQQLLRELAPPMLAALAMGVVLTAVLAGASSWTPWLKLLAVVAAGFSSFIAVLAALSWRRLEGDLQWLLSLLAKRPASSAQIEPTQTGAA